MVTIQELTGDALMSRLFGDIRQIGIVVRDIEKAMAHWADVCGIGPCFYVDKLPVNTFR